MAPSRSARLASTIRNYIKNRHMLWNKGENAASREDICVVVGQLDILFAFFEQTGLKEELLNNLLLENVLRTLKLSNLGRCGASLKDLIQNHWYEIQDLNGGCVLLFKNESSDVVCTVSCQEGIKLVEHCAHIIVRDLIRDHCQAHGDTVCQLCKHEILIRGMVSASPVVTDPDKPKEIEDECISNDGPNGKFWDNKPRAPSHKGAADEDEGSNLDDFIASSELDPDPESRREPLPVEEKSQTPSSDADDSSDSSENEKTEASDIDCQENPSDSDGSCSISFKSTSPTDDSSKNDSRSTSLPYNTYEGEITGEHKSLGQYWDMKEKEITSHAQNSEFIPSSGVDPDPATDKNSEFGVKTVAPNGMEIDRKSPTPTFHTHEFKASDVDDQENSSNSHGSDSPSSSTEDASSEESTDKPKEIEDECTDTPPYEDYPESCSTSSLSVSNDGPNGRSWKKSRAPTRKEAAHKDEGSNPDDDGPKVKFWKKRPAPTRKGAAHKDEGPNLDVKFPSDQGASEQEDKNNAEKRDLNQQTTPVADSSSGSGVAESEEFITLKTFKYFPEYREEMKRKSNMMLKYVDSIMDEIKQTIKAHKGVNCVLIYHDVVDGNHIKHKFFENVESPLEWAHRHIDLMEENYPFILVKRFKSAPNSVTVGVEATPKFSVVFKDPSNRLEPLKVQAGVDTAADDSTMGFNSEHVKRRLHSFREVEYDFKPLVYGYINVEGEDIEHICEMDVDPDSPWNGVGIRELKAVSNDTRKSIFKRFRQFFSTAQN